MNVVAARSGSFQEFVLTDMNAFSDIDVLIFGYGVLDTVKFSEELAEEGGVFYDLTLLSKDLDCVVVAACETELYGTRRKSAIVLDKGKILGISDVNRITGNEEYLPGYGYHVYATSRGNIGVILCGDCMDDACYATVARACADFALVLTDTEDGEIRDTVLKSMAVLHGLGIVCLTKTSLSSFGVTATLTAREKVETGSIAFRPQCAYYDVLYKLRGLY